MADTITPAAREPVRSEQPVVTASTPLISRPFDLAMVGLAGLMVVGLLFWGATKFTVPDPADGYDARVACEMFVLDRLTEPRTAAFWDLEHTGTAPTWTVKGWVSSLNSLRTRIRSEFTCEVRNHGDDWELVSLSGLKQ